MANQKDNKLNRSAFAGFYEDVKTSLRFFTRLPIGGIVENRQLSDAARAFSVVGLVIGGVSGIVFWISAGAGLSIYMAILLSLATALVMTGALHEDGLADFADSFGGWTKQQKLEIMHDSTIGTYGVLTLLFSTAIKIFCYSAILTPAYNSSTSSGFFGVVALFAGIGCLSRSTMALLMYQLAVARTDGQAENAGKPRHDTVRDGLFIGFGCGILLIWFGAGLPGAFAVCLTSFLAYFSIKMAANRQISGYTGDVIGSLQQVSELLCLIGLSIALS